MEEINSYPAWGESQETIRAVIMDELSKINGIGDIQELYLRVIRALDIEIPFWYYFGCLHILVREHKIRRVEKIWMRVHTIIPYYAICGDRRARVIEGTF